MFIYSPSKMGDCGDDDDDHHKIKIGDYLIVKRQNYMKLHKLKENGTLILGNFNLSMNNVIGANYFDTFQIKNDPRGNKKSYQLEKVLINDDKTVKTIECGKDNRDIIDDGQSQNLTQFDIKKLKEEQFNSNSIVEQLITNSKTFNKKTEYSQEKYIKKKEKKYFEYIEIKRPTIRLLATIFYRLETTSASNKNLNLRLDDLSQILTYSNLHTNGNHLLYDCGTNGLLAATILNRIGPNTDGHLIHLHPGNEYQKLALLAMQFPNEQLQRCINVNIYSVLRCYYQNKSSYLDNNVEQQQQDDVGEPEKKRLKLENWQQLNIRACKLLQNNVDCLIIATKEYPINIVKELITFLDNNRIMVVYNQLKEPLIDLYSYLKETKQFVAIRIFSNFMRNYQILKNRTHPEMNMTTGGYILTAIKLNK